MFNNKKSGKAIFSIGCTGFLLGISIGNTFAGDFSNDIENLIDTQIDTQMNYDLLEENCINNDGMYSNCKGSYSKITKAVQEPITKINKKIKKSYPELEKRKKVTLAISEKLKKMYNKGGSKSKKFLIEYIHWSLNYEINKEECLGVGGDMSMGAENIGRTNKNIQCCDGLIKTAYPGSFDSIGNFLGGDGRMCINANDNYCDKKYEDQRNSYDCGSGIVKYFNSNIFQIGDKVVYNYGSQNNELIGADPYSFKELYNNIYSDKNNIYYAVFLFDGNLKKIDSADAKSFTKINDIYFRDKDTLYRLYQHTYFEVGINSSFVFTNNEYTKAKDFTNEYLVDFDKKPYLHIIGSSE